MAVGVAVPRMAGDRDDDQPEEIRGGRRGLVNPLLECREGERLQRPMAPFGHLVEALIARARQAGLVHRMSVYFRDLDNGPWFGVGEHEEYRIASLLKVPLLLGYLKRAESDPRVLEQTLVYADTPQGQEIPPARTLVAGNAYTVDELLEQAIVYSDNEAAWLLTEADDGQTLDGVRALAGFPPLRDGTLYLTPRHFASMFRILYNASYLGQPMSEKGLALLTRTEFRDGLVAGLPADVRVAHKFGQGRLGDVVTLHDCGIVYHPQRPYVLCVMTEGRQIRDLERTIADVSRLVHAEVARQMTPRAVP
jgi:beta-lactamase class A